MTTRPHKDKLHASAPKLIPRPTAASIARAALNATNRVPLQQQQRPAPSKPPSSPTSKKKNNLQRSIDVVDTKTDTQENTKLQDMVAIIDTKTSNAINDHEGNIDEPVYQENPVAVPEEVRQDPHLQMELPPDCDDSLIDSIDMASTPSISQPHTPTASHPQTPTASHPQTPTASHPQTPAASHPQTPTESHPQTPTASHPQTPTASHPQTPKSPAMTQRGTRPNTPHSTVGSLHSTGPVSRPTTPKKAQPVSYPQALDAPEMDDNQLKSTYSVKQEQFQLMKKELDVKQQELLEAYDNLRNLREHLTRESGSGGGEGVMHELLVFNVAEWSADELQQLCRATFIADTDGAMQFIESVPVDESNFNEVETKVTKIPEQFADLCLQAFAARQELVDWVKELILHSDNPQDCGEGETLQRIANYDSQGRQLCTTLQELKEQADSAVDTMSYFSKRVWKDQNALISVGKVLVRDVARLKQNLDTQANLVEKMRSQLFDLQRENNNVEDIRRELEEESVAKNMLKEKLAASENQNRVTRNRVTKMDRQLREAEASIATLTSTVKVLEEQSRQREVQIEVRARKMRESLKTGEVASSHLAQKRDALQAEVLELKDQIEQLSASYNSNLKDLENQLQETKSALEEQIKINQQKDIELATARDEALAESKATVEQLVTKINELENKASQNGEHKHPNSRESELLAELHATKEALRMVEEEVIVYKQEKVRFLETLAKIAESDDKVGIQQKLAAELLGKEEIIGKLQGQLRELTKNDILLAQKLIQYEQYVKALQTDRTGVTELEESQKDFQKEILDVRMKLLEEVHRNEELTEALAKKDHQLEQQDKTSRAQARVIKVREELINMLKNKETEQTRELLALQQDLGNRMKIVDDVNKQIAAKAVEIQDLFSTLEGKQQQIHRLEKIVLMLEEQQRRSQAQRTRHEEKIAGLERELAAGCRRERKYLFF